MIGSLPAAALDEPYCAGYAEVAVRQYEEYASLGCTGRSDWFSGDPDYHKGWCILQPDIDVAAEGQAAREAFLGRCQWVKRAAPEAGGSAGGPVPADFACPYVFGAREFREDEIEGGVALAADGRSARAQCNYRVAEGTVTLYAVWVPNGVELVPGTSYPGCTRLTGAAQYYEGTQGYEFRSEDQAAHAGVIGDTPAAIALVLKHAQGPAQDMFVLAQIYGRPCPRI
jgi:hypothetical protein